VVVTVREPAPPTPPIDDFERLPPGTLDPVWRDPVWRDPVWRDPVWRDPVWRDPVWRDPVWPDRVWPTGFLPPHRAIDQGMTPAVYVQRAVAESRELSHNLMARIGSRAAGGAGDFLTDGQAADLGQIDQSMAPAEHVGRDGVAFSRQLIRDIQRTLAARGLGADLPADRGPLSGEPGSLALPQTGAAETPAETPAEPHAGAPGRGEAPTQAPASARSFSERLAASAGQRGSARTIADTPVRIRVAAGPSA
ncbi:MAG: hypothetical protein WCY32_06260, partial [Burkholderiaceae bacterium]